LPTGKILSVRLPEDQATDLEMFAQFDGVAVAEEVRHAIELLLESRRKDPKFRERVLAAVERSRKLLSELGEDAAAGALEVEEQKPKVRAARPRH
jgi:hypothetical protein